MKLLLDYEEHRGVNIADLACFLIDNGYHNVSINIESSMAKHGSRSIIGHQQTCGGTPCVETHLLMVEY